jgi:drug/metabolite transporter (DMT)-like permease
VTVAAEAAQLAARRDERLGRTYIVLAALAWSSAGVLQRSLAVGTTTQLAGRALFALLGLLAFAAVAERGRLVSAFARMGRAGIGFALCMAVSSGAFIVALNHTTVANVLFLQAASPIVAALLARVLLGEAVVRQTWLAMGVALVGVGVMVGGPGGWSLGVAVAAVMMLGFAGSVVFARHRSDVSMAPATCLAQLLVFAGAAPFAAWGAVDGRGLGLLAALGIGQIGAGLAFMTLGARLIPAAEVALLSLLEVVLGPLWVWLARSERPAWTTIAGGLVVVAAVAIQTRRA